MNFIETTRSHYNKETHKPGHNSSLLDTPVLLRSGGFSFVDQLTSLDVVFADSLLLFKSVRKSELPSSAILLPCKSNKLTSLYSHLLDKDFHAHDAIEDVKALIKILFKSSLKVTSEQVMEHGRVATAKQACDDLVFLDQRHARAENYRRMCHSDGRSVISEAMKQKLFVKGIIYETLAQTYRQFGKAGRFANFPFTKYRIQQESSNHSLSQDSTHSSRYLQAEEIPRFKPKKARIPGLCQDSSRHLTCPTSHGRQSGFAML